MPSNCGGQLASPEPSSSRSGPVTMCSASDSRALSGRRVAGPVGPAVLARRLAPLRMPARRRSPPGATIRRGRLRGVLLRLDAASRRGCSHPGWPEAAPDAQNPPPAHQALPTTNERQGRALHPHAPWRLGLRCDLRKLNRADQALHGKRCVGEQAARVTARARPLERAHQLVPARHRWHWLATHPTRAQPNRAARLQRVRARGRPSPG